jgi:hypothetical protein
VGVAVRVAGGEASLGLGVGVGVATSATRVGVKVDKGVAVAVTLGVGVAVWVRRGLSPTGLGLAGWGLKLHAVTIIIPKPRVVRTAR